MFNYLLFLSLIISQALAGENLRNELITLEKLNSLSSQGCEENSSDNLVDEAEVKMSLDCQSEAVLRKHNRLKAPRFFNIQFFETNPPTLMEQGLIVRQREETDADLKPILGKNDFTIKKRPMVPPADWRSKSLGSSKYKCERDITFHKKGNDISCSVTDESAQGRQIQSFLQENYPQLKSSLNLAELEQSKLPVIRSTKWELKKLNLSAADVVLEKWLVPGKMKADGTLEKERCLMEISVKVKLLKSSEMKSQQDPVVKVMQDMEKSLKSLGIKPLKQQGNKTGKAIEHLK